MTVRDTLRAHQTTGRAESVVRFVRLFSMGATILYPIVGLATATGTADALDLVKLIVLGVLFHVYADVGNDVMDLPIDRTDPRRARGPLVSGRVSPQTALVLALATVPLMTLVLIAETVSVALAVALGLIGVYNVVGKALPVPVLADFVQGAGWAALVFVGANVAGGPGPATWWAAAVVVAYIAMVNGVSGAVRDVENDRRAGALTTAVLLGVHIRDRSIRLTTPIVVYAVVLQMAIGLTLARVLLSSGDGLLWILVVVATGVVFAVSTWMLFAAYRNRSDLGTAMAAGTWHLFLVPLGLLVATVWALGPSMALIVAVVFVAPPLVYGRVLGETEKALPSTTIGDSLTASREWRTRVGGLWQMTRIGVPAASAGLVLVGAHLSGDLPASVIGAMVATALAVAAANVFNDRCDMAADRVNRPHRPIPSGVVSENDADKYVLVASCGAFAFAAVLGVGSMAFVGVMLAFGLAYSLVLRRVVGMGQVAVSFLFAMPIIYGSLIFGGLTSESWIAAGLVFFFVFARETLKGFPDRDGDRAAEYHTVATHYGKAGVLVVFRMSAIVLIVGALATAAYVGTAAHLTATIVCIVVPAMFAMIYLREPDAVAIERATAGLGYVFALGLVPLALMG